MSHPNDHLLQIMQTKKLEPNQYNFESLSIPHWTYYISPKDVEYINKMVTSIKYAGNVEKKLKLIKTVMEANGFKRFAGGTNRVVYKHMEDTRFLAKIAIDRVGMSDNPNEFRNQELLKPFCAKMFQVTPCGTIGFSERVIPIMRRGEFEVIAGDVYEILDSLLDRYVLEDVGTSYFMNWGISSRIGPVLLDYPYVYELDYKKLICKRDVPIDRNFPDIRETCNGFIDYDDGFNHLYCSRCKRKYEAVELKKYIENNQLIIQEGGSVPMKVSLKRGNEVIKTVNESDIIVSTASKIPMAKNQIRVSLVRGDKVVTTPGKTVNVPLEAPSTVKDINIPEVNVSLNKGKSNSAHATTLEDTEVEKEEVPETLVDPIPEVIEDIPQAPHDISPETLVESAPPEEEITKTIDNSNWEEHISNSDRAKENEVVMAQEEKEENVTEDDEAEVEESHTEMKPYYTKVSPNEDADDTNLDSSNKPIVYNGVQEVIDDPKELNAAVGNMMNRQIHPYKPNSVTPPQTRDAGPVPMVTNTDTNTNTKLGIMDNTFIPAARRTEGRD